MYNTYRNSIWITQDSGRVAKQVFEKMVLCFEESTLFAKTLVQIQVETSTARKIWWKRALNQSFHQTKFSALANPARDKDSPYLKWNFCHYQPRRIYNKNDQPVNNKSKFEGDCENYGERSHLLEDCNQSKEMRAMKKPQRLKEKKQLENFKNLYSSPKN